MSTALAIHQSQAIAQPIEYSREQLDLIKDTYAKGASDAEFALFVETAKYRGLDIMKKQICLIGYWDGKASKNIFQPVVTIEGQRSKAEASGLYRGQTMPMWCGRDGKWVDVWLEDGPPAAAKIGVYREGFAEPIWAVARFDSYAAKKDGKPIAMWAKMPDVMIAKCAESLALRKAFPEVLGGIYSDVELEQARNEKNVTPQPVATIDPSYREQAYASMEYLWGLSGKSKAEWANFKAEKLDKAHDKAMPEWIDFLTNGLMQALREMIVKQITELSAAGYSDQTLKNIIAGINTGTYEVEQLDVEGLARTRDELADHLKQIKEGQAAA